MVGGCSVVADKIHFNKVKVKSNLWDGMECILKSGKKLGVQRSYYIRKAKRIVREK